MKRTIYLIVLLGLFILSTDLFSQCASPANIYTFSHGGKTYEVVKEIKNWADAAACAVERGGYLVEINDSNEQLAVYNAISNAGVSPTYTSVSNGGGIAYVWIGATDQLSEGTWLWDGNNDHAGVNFWTGQGAAGSGGGGPVGGSYYSWGGKSTGTVKEPDNYGAGQHHAAIGLTGWPSGSGTLGSAGEWNDIIGSSLLYFIIEKGQGVGKNEEPSRKKLKVYPNPSSDKLFLDGPDPEAGQWYVIYNGAGTETASGKLKNNNEIDITGLPRGIYIISIEGAVPSLVTFIKE